MHATEPSLDKYLLNKFKPEGRKEGRQVIGEGKQGRSVGECGGTRQVDKGVNRIKVYCVHV